MMNFRGKYGAGIGEKENIPYLEILSLLHEQALPCHVIDYMGGVTK